MIGKALKYMRSKKGYNQEQLAALLNVKQNTLSRYENEVSDANFDTIEKIANICEYKVVFKNKNEEFTPNDLKRKDI